MVSETFPLIPQYASDLLDRLHEMPFEEAYQTAQRLMFSLPTRIVTSDARFIKWARDNFHEVQRVAETFGLITQTAQMEKARKNHEAKLLRKAGT